jgi:alanine-glyoxylate transaminase / serine-glyoxylate transaminase / serine-pyruvate transaminase
MRLKLMIPGPIEVEDEVLEWMGAPVHPHYGDEWVAVHNETIGLLQQIIGTSGKVFLMPGSGSLGVDAAVQSTFAPGSKVALGLNGHFGLRLKEILEANGVIVVPIETPPSTPLPPQQFEDVLRADSSIAGVAVVHLETSTAILNPVREIARIARAHNRLCLVDTVSSLGGTPYHMDEWGIDVTITASQKGLGGVPGVAIVAVGARGWDAITHQPDYPRSWYLDLRRWQWYAENWGDWHPFPVTMPTSVILGLRAALQSLIGDGLEQRFQRYETLAHRLREGLRQMGLTTAVDESVMAPVLTAVNMPAGAQSSDLVRYVASNYSIKITGGFGASKEQVFRIGHMGAVLSEADIDALLAAVRQFLAERQPQQPEH